MTAQAKVSASCVKEIETLIAAALTLAQKQKMAAPAQTKWDGFTTLQSATVYFFLSIKASSWSFAAGTIN